MEQMTDSGLVRGIRRWDFLALAINSSIGAGIFGLPSKVYALTGTYSLFAFLVCAILIILIILCFAEVAGRFKDTGGPYLYTREAFGPVVGFEVGWLLWLTRLASFAAICNLLVSYLAYFWPAASSGWWRALVITGVVISLTIINIIGIREAALVSNIFTVGKLIPLLLFVAAGVFFVNPHQFSFATQPGYGSFSQAVLLLVFMFMGFETTLIPSGEVQEPQRTIPFALLSGIGVVALLYILIQFVCVGTLPELAHSERPLTDAASRFLGVVGAAFIGVGALLSMMGILHLAMLATPRLPFAMAEQGQLPRILSTTHRRFHTPYVAILLTAAIMLVLALSGTFIYAVTISVIIRLIVYASTCAALPILRRRSDKRPTSFMVPAGAAVSVISLVLCVWLLSNSGWREARDTMIAAAAGLILYFAYRLRGRPAAEAQR
jgi:APA family basic amino acid/polyamine antiporter